MYPEAVNPQGDIAQQQPDDPVAQQLDGFAVKPKPMPIDYGVPGLPAVKHTHSPGEADSEGTDRHQDPQQGPTDLL